MSMPKLIARLWFCSRLLAKRPRGVTVPRHLAQNATMQPCPTKGGLQKQFRGADLAKFHGRVYGRISFCCKTAQFGATLRELTQVRPSLKNTLRKTVKVCANTR